MLLSKNILGYVTCSSNYKWDKLKIYSFNIRTHYKHRNITSHNAVHNTIQMIKYNRVFMKTNNEMLEYKGFVLRLLKNRAFCTVSIPKEADTFGDIGYTKYDKADMDAKEKEEEEFRDNEVTIPRRFKPSTGQYSAMIKSHIGKGDLSSALNVLQLVKTNRDKPTVYMFNLLMRAYAVQGDMKQCFKLYNKMKKHQLTPNAATYTNLLNACAEYKDTTTALEQLNKVRVYLYEKNIILNETNYNTIIKAYGRHNKILQAFEVVDEMRDKGFRVTDLTCCNLLQSAISNKEAGMKYALIIWYLMQKFKIKPSLTTYNLLLRAIRDTKFGNVKLRDILPHDSKNEVKYIVDGPRPDLLSNPPTISTLTIPIINTDQNAVISLNHLEEEKSHLILSLDTDVDKIFTYNRLILFGGFKNILNNMQTNDITPNVITATLLLDLLPNTTSAENDFLNYITNKNIKLDIDFYNILIKRRSMRKEYNSAKDILVEIQRKHMIPNLQTFGVLALGCHKAKEARELLDGLEIAGYVPNAVILGALISNACHRFNIKHIIELLHYIIENKIKPSDKLISLLENYKEVLENMVKSKKKNSIKNKSLLKKDLENFEREYSKWKIKVDELVKNK